MKDEEVNFKKKAPPLPPNYVSLADLQERWLQRKREEEEEEEEEEGRQKAQAETRNRENLKPVQDFFKTPQNRNNRGSGIGGSHVFDHRVDSRKELQGFSGANGMGKSVHGDWNKEGNYKKKYQWVKNDRYGVGKTYGLGKIEGEEDSDRSQGGNRGSNGSILRTTSVCMVAVVSETVSKQEKLIRNSGENMRRDRMNNGDCEVEASGSKDKVKCLHENAMTNEDLGFLRVKKFPAYGDELEQNGGGDCMMEVEHENKVKEGALIGTGSSKGSEQFSGEVESYGLGKTEEEGDSDRIQGVTRRCNDSTEGTSNVCMVDVVSENVSKENKPEKLIRKSGGNTKRYMKNLRNNDCGVEASGSKYKVKVLPENATRKEDLGVSRVNKFSAYGGELELDSGRNDDDDCMVEIVHENKVNEGALVRTGSSKGSEQFSGEVERKGRKLKVSKDKKKPLVEPMLKGVKDEVLIGYNGRNLQQGRKGKEVQVYRRKEGISENSSTRITGNFRGLSLDYNRESKVTSRMVIPGGKGRYKMYGGNREMQNPADNRFVWVKKGEMSDTNVAELSLIT